MNCVWVQVFVWAQVFVSALLKIRNSELVRRVSGVRFPGECGVKGSWLLDYLSKDGIGVLACAPIALGQSKLRVGTAEGLGL